MRETIQPKNQCRQLQPMRPRTIAEDSEQANDEPTNGPTNAAVAEVSQQEHEEQRQLVLERQMDAKYGPRTSSYGFRPRRPRSYAHLHVMTQAVAEPLAGTMLTQYSVKRGLKEFGEAGADAVVKELQQLHDRGVMTPKMASELSGEEKRGALQYLMFLKKKRDGVIKGRGCADGRKQREHLGKEDTTSPTVTTEGLMLSCMIDAKERRDVATADIPGAFMQTDLNEKVHMRLDGAMAELLLKIDAKLYRKYLVQHGNKSVMYVELQKALYGTLDASLLFWKELTRTLEGWGFKRNPYDWCVMNKTIDGHQCTVLWHVDDLKISHVDSGVVDKVLRDIDDKYGKEAPITQTRGKVHEYLGMTLDYREDGVVKVTMVDYINKMLTELPTDMNGVAPSPAANHLFKVNDSDPKKLDKDTSDMFHRNVAKLLFLSKRARPDIQTSVAFLCTRVKEPDHDDYKKLARVMKYLRGTRTLPLRLKADDSGVMKWWVDGSFAVHPDMRSHTGGTMSLGKGSPINTSTRQKLNTKSSTETELVAVDDVMPQILWSRSFLEAQGYKVSDNVVYQDNQSAMLLERNGKRSSSKRTRHIDIRYFFVTDRIESKEMRVEYCPTGDMVADFFTKPLQGAAFRKFRDTILNVNERDLKELLEMNLSDEHLANKVSHHRSVLGTNDETNDGDGKRRTDDLNVDHRSEEADGWTVVQRR